VDVNRLQPGVARGGLRVLKYNHRPDGQGAAVLAAVDRRAIEGALARAPDEQREAVMSVMAQEREQGRIEGRAEG
jgi:DNA-directed RNA polymerase specialized sigma24 family protein